jgi:PAS domain-containing protein
MRNLIEEGVRNDRFPQRIIPWIQWGILFGFFLIGLTQQAPIPFSWYRIFILGDLVARLNAVDQYGKLESAESETVSDYNHPDMDPNDYLSGFPFAVTMCDTEGTFIYMNPAAEALFAKDGGRAQLGSNLFDCHSPVSQEIIRNLMRDQKSNVYSTEKHGKKRLIYQAPWYRNGDFAGLVEISFEIPPSTPNFIRE